MGYDWVSDWLWVARVVIQPEPWLVIGILWYGGYWGLSRHLFVSGCDEHRCGGWQDVAPANHLFIAARFGFNAVHGAVLVWPLNYLMNLWAPSVLDLVAAQRSVAEVDETPDVQGMVCCGIIGLVMGPFHVCFSQGMCLF